MKALLASGWPGDVRARLWTRRGRRAPFGVQLEHRHAETAVLWVESHHMVPLSWWQRLFTREVPDDLTHFSRRVLGHALHRLRLVDEGPAGREARRVVLGLAARMGEREVWQPATVRASGSELHGFVHTFADGASVYVGESNDMFLGVLLAATGPNLETVDLTPVEMTPPKVGLRTT